MTKVPSVEVPIVLLGAYYAFNMQYPAGLRNAYTFLELQLCGIAPKKLPKTVEKVLTCINHIIA